MNIKTTNPYLLNWLINNDYDKKSEVSPNKLILKIPIENRKYFILGLIDGDGCIYYNKKEYLSQVTITSTYEQDWSYFEDFFRERNIKYRIKKTTRPNYQKYSQIRITNKSDVLKLCSELYENYDITKIGLNRKYLKFKEILNSTILPYERIKIQTNRL